MSKRNMIQKNFKFDIDNPDMARALELMQNRDKTLFHQETDYITHAILSFEGEDWQDVLIQRVDKLLQEYDISKKQQEYLPKK